MAADDLTPMIGRIDAIDLQAEIQSSYLDYAMSVIVGRALPDVRDGLKPVHRRVLYAMWDGGYRPDRGWNKCSRVVGEVMGLYHPHGDSAIYDTLVRLAQPWAMRHPLVSGQGNFGSQGNDKAAAMRYTECKMAPLAVEMVREIEQNTVDFRPNYDNREEEPVVLPARFPNLLVNGSTGIAVGMATNIPTHNLREVNDAVQWALANPGASREELLEAAMQRIQGPDFPGGGLIVGRSGIEEAYRTGRGSVTMRAVIDMEEDAKGRQLLVVTELPYMCNPDALAQKIADLVNSGRLTGIADIRDDTSARTGTRLVFVLKRDAQPRVVMNNLYKHTALQDTFGCNMLAIVEEVPRTLRLDQFLSLWIKHQLEVIRRRTQWQVDEEEKLAHIDRGLVKALNMLDEVIALIRASRTADEASVGLQQLLGIDEIQARAVLDQQLRRLASMEIQKIVERLAVREARIADLRAILADEGRQRQIISTELQEIVDKYGEERRTRIVAADGDFSEEDFIPNEDVVVTITHGGYAKRTRADQYRLQKRGGKGVRGASLRADDEVQHLFTTSNHQWILFFSNFGRVYRSKAWQLPEAGRDAKGGHVAGLMNFLPDEKIAQVLTLNSYDDAPYLLLATKRGLVKKTDLKAYDSPRQAGVIAINFREEGDELIGASLVSSVDDVLLISRKGQAIRFQADDSQLRPMGRATSGVSGMKFRAGDELLSMAVLRADVDYADQFVFTVTDGGFAKRTLVEEYRQQGRGGLGIKAMKLSEDRGQLVGGLIVGESDEVMAIKVSGQVTRSAVADVPVKGRDTMGVKFVGVRGEDAVGAIARYPESEDVEAVDEAESEQPGSVGDANVAETVNEEDSDE
ncbi:DNA gyrase subunit A [Tessaracoccus bendigoensis DSM 12906]|uniref:DNA topoisomerase (ATP-hydrolyzing) n=1 Tax=Tessaracoccus bendigoensis DSM 12906 TaxID=1123357 RepID=A0A1M6HD31_9ACTN|nr:DNA gyrase subunit A [Tessaracoccus bendigoensis]SHJ20188.1 DNA gyrase subunit A [Tessaracoccus bendigoensis DSM 12906]